MALALSCGGLGPTPRLSETFDLDAYVPGVEVPLPAHLPEPAIPRANPYRPAKAELGRHLFYDRRLSVDESYACASCHRQELAFTDGRVTAVGATGEAHRRNTMSLANVVYNGSFNWADGSTSSLEEQMLVPMFSNSPVELGLPSRAHLVAALRGEPRYEALFAAAFPDDPEPLVFDNVVRAIATFERSLVSVDSAYDRFVRDGDRASLTPEAERGMEMFFSARLACSQCHRGPHLGGNTTWFGKAPAPLEFHNTGLYNLRGGAYPANDRGRIEETGRPEDMGRFRAPSLRNVALTAPYMHDGSVATLEEVVAHYSAGGRTIRRGPYRGVGRRNRYKSARLHRLRLDAAEAADLVSFLRSLTDRSFVDDPRYRDPWPQERPPATGGAAHSSSAGR